MTQFLLAAFPDARVPAGYAAIDTRGLEYLEDAAACIFPNAGAVVKIAPPDGEMDSVVDATREEMAGGAPFETTPLGALLGELATHCEFALFWAGDYADLPSASNMSELREVLTPQILAEVGNWELYAYFVGTSQQV